jgi:phosphoglycerate dehydrogenase-like enzyme
LCDAFGMRVLGIDPRTAEAPPGFDEVAGPDQLDDRLGQADFVIVTTPETPETRRLFDAGRFAAMKQGSYLINIARGALVVTDDLVAALRSGHLAGAGLDVVDPEPLPADHPLWTLPGVLLTPHVAIAGAPGWYERRTAIVLENCRRFARGDELVNVVDKHRWF